MRDKIEEFEAPEGYKITSEKHGNFDVDVVGEDGQPHYLFTVSNLREARDRAEDHARGIRYVNIYKLEYKGKGQYRCWRGLVICSQIHPDINSAEKAYKKFQEEYKKIKVNPNEEYEVLIEAIAAKRF